MIVVHFAAGIPISRNLTFRSCLSFCLFDEHSHCAFNQARPRAYVTPQTDIYQTTRPTVPSQHTTIIPKMPSQRKGCKSRKGAKQRKARQARKHREARQTRRERKNRRHLNAVPLASDHESEQDLEPARPSAGITRFYRFPDLPLELREMIWDKCIPSRLVIPDLNLTTEFHNGPPDSQRHPPKISQVCHEARGVALRYGSRITLGTWHREMSTHGRRPDDTTDDKAWFDTSRDTLLFSQTKSERRKSFKAFTPSLKRISDEAISAVTTSGRLGSLSRDRGSIYDVSGTNMFSSEWLQKADVAYVVQGYYLSADLAAVVDSGLFGLFGENRIIMVDLDDTETFPRLKRLRIGFPFERFSLYVDFQDIEEAPEINRDQIPEHGRSRWLFETFCNNKARGYAHDTTYPEEFEQFFKDTPNFRLVALVILCLDCRFPLGPWFDELSRESNDRLSSYRPAFDGPMALGQVRHLMTMNVEREVMARQVLATNASIDRLVQAAMSRFPFLASYRFFDR